MNNLEMCGYIIEEAIQIRRGDVGHFQWTAYNNKVHKTLEGAKNAIYNIQQDTSITKLRLKAIYKVKGEEVYIK